MQMTGSFFLKYHDVRAKCSVMEKLIVRTSSAPQNCTYTIFIQSLLGVVFLLGKPRPKGTCQDHHKEVMTVSVGDLEFRPYSCSVILLASGGYCNVGSQPGD